MPPAFLLNGAVVKKKCCVFVDGENLRHAIVDLFENEFDQRDYLPKRADWGGFYDWLVRKASPDLERVRTYWYTIEQLDIFPYHFPSDQEKLKRLLCKDPTHAKEISDLQGQALRQQMQAIVDELKRREEAQRSRFRGWMTVQDGISLRHPAIEFRRAGAIRYNLFDRRLGAEKAVDVKLATDLIMLRDIYDLAIIVSGDQDYVPAVQVVKDAGKTVINVAFETRSGKLLPGGARRLNQVTDSNFPIPYGEFKAHLNL